MHKLVAIAVIAFVSYVTCQKGMPGGFSEADRNDEKIQRMASIAVGELGSEYELVEVVSARQQVVNGIMFHITVMANRNINGQTKNRVCSMWVLEVPHRSYLELEEFHCHFANKAPRIKYTSI